MLLSSLFSSRDQDAADAFLSARNEVQTKVAVLESLEVPALSAHLSVAVLKLSVRGAKQLWLDKRNDSSSTEIDIMLDCPGADLIETMSLQTGNYVGVKGCSQALLKDLAATGYSISMTHFDPQSVCNNCGPISFLVASVAIQTGGLPSTDTTNACVEFSTQLGSAARSRSGQGDGKCLFLSDTYTFFAGVLDQDGGVAATRLNQGDLFRHNDRSRITSVLQRACDEGKDVFIGESLVCTQQVSLFSPFSQLCF